MEKVLSLPKIHQPVTTIIYIPMKIRLLALAAASAATLGAMAAPEVPDSISLTALTAMTDALPARQP